MKVEDDEPEMIINFIAIMYAPDWAERLRLLERLKMGVLGETPGAPLYPTPAGAATGP